MWLEARWHLHKETRSFSKQEKHPACHHVNYSDYSRTMTIVSHVGRGGGASDGGLGFTDVLSLPGERKGGRVLATVGNHLAMSDASGREVFRV